MPLPPEQKWFFRHNGFLQLDALPVELVEEACAEIWADIEAEKEPVVRAADGSVHRLSNIIDRHPVFMKIVTWPAIVDALRAFIGPNVELHRNRHNHATLRKDTGSVYWHRDVRTFTHTCITAIVYLEEANLENGCTQVVPGSQNLPWYEFPLEKNQEIIDAGLLEQAVRLPMPAGGILLMDGCCIHSPGMNDTDGTRMSMTLGYHGVNEFRKGEDPKSLLICGERIYDGNDRAR